MGLVYSVTNLISAFVFRFIGFMIRELYSLIVLLADANVLENEAFDNVKDNVFGLIGLFMVFKLTFSIIQYITNPDKLTDSSIGASKVLTKVVVVLILLGTIDTIFEKAFELQGLILKNGVLEKIVFGESPDSTSGKIEQFDKEENKIKTSDYLAYSILAPFVSYNIEKDIWGGLDETTLKSCNDFMRATNMTYKSDNDICKSRCVEVMRREDSDAVKSMCKGLAERNMYKALVDVVMLRINKEPALVVDGLFGLLVGAVCVVVLVIIAVGVAIRSVKLAFLSLIAPLPIISYIDPKDNTNGMFHKWKNESIKTFLELFIRLLSFYFAVMVITRVLVDDNGFQSFTGSTNYTFENHPMVVIFLIIGCFLFALQLPKLIENLFGSLGGFSRDAKSTGAIAAGLGGIAGGIIGGGIANAIGTGKFLKDENGGKVNAGIIGRSLLAGATGAVGTGFGSIGGALKGMKASGGGLSGAKWNDIASGAIGRTGAIRNARQISYTTAGGKVKSAYPFMPSVRSGYGKFAAMAGIKDDFSAVGRKKADVKEIENAIRGYQNDLSKASGDRMAALQQYNAAKHDREMLQSNSQSIDKDMFKDMGGKFDEGLGDYVFNVNGRDVSLSNLSHSEYRSLYTDARRNATDKDAFDRKFTDYNTTTFEMQKNRIEDSIRSVRDYEERLQAAIQQESAWSSAVSTATANYDTINGRLAEANKMLSKANKQIETINKANKKS